MRIAIISTPRSGNTWVRRVLRDTLQLEEIAAHNPREVPDLLPARVVIQLHWYREPNLQAFLHAQGFRIVVLGRHPLDVLISVLHFVRHEPLTARWLEGNAELPADLGRHSPASEPFLRYATSWGAENLLSISYQWCHEPEVIRVRYEDLVYDPVTVFEHLITQLGGSTDELKSALNASRFEVFQATPNRHGWQGTPNLWQQLLPPFSARCIRQRHRAVFEKLGYNIPFYLLSRGTATRNWERLVRA